MNERPIHYEPHPVSQERKAELLAKGVQIIDIKFKPKDEPAASSAMPVEPQENGDGVWRGAIDEMPLAPPKPRGKPGRKPKA